MVRFHQFDYVGLRLSYPTNHSVSCNRFYALNENETFLAYSFTVLADLLHFCGNWKMDFFCPSGPSPGCFVVYSWNIWSKPLMLAKWSFPPRWHDSGIGLHSWTTWLPAARPNGWSTPSGLSPAPSKSWTTLAVIPTGWPSPIIVCIRPTPSGGATGSS
jgi:hypothetical protein